MSQTIVRLQGLELRNIKNVEFGKIEMPNSYQNERRYNNSEILGLYGQNGSGKTAVIDTMYFLQKFMTGESIEKKLTDYINMKKESAELKASFIIFEDNIMYDVDYNICIGREKDNFAVIEKESLSCSKIIEDKKINNKIIFMEFKRDNREDIFTPKKRLESRQKKWQKNQIVLIYLEQIAGKSFLRNMMENFSNILLL